MRRGDALDAFLARWGGTRVDTTETADPGHSHAASDIEGPFSNISVTGDIWAEVWDGGVPADLSSGAVAASTGFYLDSSAGAIQCQALYAENAVVSGILTAGAGSDIPFAYVSDVVITPEYIDENYEIVGVGAALPTEGMEEGDLFFLTTDGKLYRYHSAAWTAAVPTTDLTGTIATLQLADDAVTAAKLAVAAIDGVSGNLVSGSVGTDQLVALSVTAAKIAANTITASQIAAGTITATQIAAATILGTNIAATTISGSNIAAATITGGNIAALTIQAGNIAANAITTDKIAANTIEAGDIKAGTITGNEIAALTITAANIAAGTITADKLTVSKLDAIAGNMGTLTVDETITLGPAGIFHSANSGARLEFNAAAGTDKLFIFSGAASEVAGKIQGSASPIPSVTFASPYVPGGSYTAHASLVLQAGSPSGSILVYGHLLSSQANAYTLGSAALPWLASYATTSYLGAGTAAAPSLSFASAATSGIYYAAGLVGISIGGVGQVAVNDGAFYGITANDIDLGTSALPFKSSWLNAVYDEANVLRLDLNGAWSPAGSIIPTVDITPELGSATYSWGKVFTASILDEAGTERLDLNGNWTCAGQLLVKDGVVASPGLAFANDLDTGIILPADGVLAVVTAGGVAARFYPTYQVPTGSLTTGHSVIRAAAADTANVTYSYVNDADTGTMRGGTNILDQVTAGVVRHRLDANGYAYLYSIRDVGNYYSMRWNNTTSEYGYYVSSERVKRYVTPLDDPKARRFWQPDAIDRIRPITYVRRSTNSREIGFSAENLADVNELLTVGKGAGEAPDEFAILAVAIHAIQDLRRQVASLEAERKAA